MATRFSIQRDKRSAITYGFEPSDTQASIAIPSGVDKTVTVPANRRLAMVSVQGAVVYYGQNAAPEVPIASDFVFQVGHQLGPGSKTMLSVEPGDVMHFEATSAGEIEIDFFENEKVD